MSAILNGTNINADDIECGRCENDAPYMGFIALNADNSVTDLNVGSDDEPGVRVICLQCGTIFDATMREVDRFIKADIDRVEREWSVMQNLATRDM